MLIGKCVLWWLLVILAVVSLMVLVMFFGRWFSLVFIDVVVFLISFSVWMNLCGMCWLDIGKLFIVCCVCVFYNVLVGICSLFMLLCLILKFLFIV